MPGWLKLAIGAAAIAGSFFTGGATGIWFLGAQLSATVTSTLITAGIGMALTGVGTLLSPGTALASQPTMVRNPIAPRMVIYGRARVGGTLIFLNEFGSNNKYLDLVIVLACHKCQDVWGLLIDNQRVQIDTTKVPSGVAASTFPAINGGTSFTPAQQTINNTSLVRKDGVVTVQLPAAIPLLALGDRLKVAGVTTDASLNGVFPVQSANVVLGSPGTTAYTYLCGGSDVSVGAEGTTKTQWPDYGPKIYMEVMKGDQTLGTTFVGMTSGTPDDGNTGSLITNSANPWGANCSLVGQTAVFLRLHYDAKYFPSGLPQISFLIHGKNDIYDPRLGSYGGGGTTAYTENAALCIADYLSNETWGFKAVYDSEIDLSELTVQANLCDQEVQLRTVVQSTGYGTVSTEPRYTLNGRFTLDRSRGEILQNMLTSCGGRLTYEGGKFILDVAAWEPGLTFFTAGEPLLVPSGAQKFTLAWGEHAGYLGDFTSGITEVVFDGAGGATIQWRGYGSRRAQLTNNWGTASNHNLVSATNPGPVAIPIGDIPAVGSELQIILSNSEGTFKSGAAAHSSDGHAHAYLSTDGGTAATSSSGYPAGPYGGTSGGPTAGTTYPPTDFCAPHSIRWKPAFGVHDLYNGVKGTYISQANNWQAADFPPYCQDSLHGYYDGGSSYSYDKYLEADGGDRRWLDVQLPFTISPSMAQRLAKIELLRRRNQGTGTFGFNLSGYQIRTLDVLRMTCAALGWAGKDLDVLATRLKLERGEGDSLALTTEIDVQETDPTVYDWFTTEELTPEGYQQAGLPNVTAPAAPTSLTLTTADGSIGVSWTAPADGYAETIQIAYKLHAGSTWVAQPSVPVSVTAAVITGVVNGSAYDVEIRSVNGAGVPSDWVTAGPVTVSGAPVGITVNGV